MRPLHRNLEANYWNVTYGVLLLGLGLWLLKVDVPRAVYPVGVFGLGALYHVLMTLLEAEYAWNHDRRRPQARRTALALILWLLAPGLVLASLGPVARWESALWAGLALQALAAGISRPSADLLAVGRYASASLVLAALAAHPSLSPTQHNMEALLLNLPERLLLALVLGLAGIALSEAATGLRQFALERPHGWRAAWLGLLQHLALPLVIAGVLMLFRNESLGQGLLVVGLLTVAVAALLWGGSLLQGAGPLPVPPQQPSDSETAAASGKGPEKPGKNNRRARNVLLLLGSPHWPGPERMTRGFEHLQKAGSIRRLVVPLRHAPDLALVKLALQSQLPVQVLADQRFLTDHAAELEPLRNLAQRVDELPRPTGPDLLKPLYAGGASALALVWKPDAPEQDYLDLVGLLAFHGVPVQEL